MIQGPNLNGRERRSLLGSFLDSLWHDLRFATRMLGKKPGFTAIALLTLALGIGANAATFSIVNAVLLRPLPYPQPERIMSIDNTVPVGATMTPTSLHWAWRDWADHLKSLERFAAYGTGDINFAMTGALPERLPAAEVSPNFFESFAVNPIAGRLFSREEQSPNHALVAVLGYAQCKKLGDPQDLIGKTILLNGKPATVIGVMPPEFEFPGKTQVWLPFAWDFSEEMLLKQSIFFQAIGRLRPGASAAQAQQELQSIEEREFEALPKLPGRTSIQRPAAKVVPLHEDLVASSRKALWILLGAVGFVMLIACADVANLLLGRAVERQHEIAVRAVLGASRGRLLRQVLTESMLLSLLGAGAGALIGDWTLQAVRGQLPPSMRFVRDVHLDSRVFLFLLGVCVASGALFGLFPALHGLRSQLGSAIKQATLPSQRTFLGRSRSLLATAEVAIAVVLVTGAGLMIRSFARLTSIDPGFRAAQTLTARISLPMSTYAKAEQRVAFFSASLEKIAAIPGVADAAYTSDLPFGNANGIAFKPALEHETPAHLNAAETQFASYFTVSSTYFQAMGIPLLSGRAFDDRDNASTPHVVIVNHRLASLYWPGDSPLGRRMALQGHESGRLTPGGRGPDWAEIVGIVGDNKHSSLQQEVAPAYYVPLLQAPVSSVFLVVRASGDAGATVGAVRESMAAVDNTMPLSDFASMGERVEASVAEPRFRTMLLGIFAVIALLLAAAGVYGVMFYSVAQRTREIGIRMALGAQVDQILRMVLTGAMKPVLVGVALGLAGALALGRLLQSLLFGVKPTDTATLAVVCLLLAAVACAASLVPALRATRVDPLQVLREE